MYFINYQLYKFKAGNKRNILCLRSKCSFNINNLLRFAYWHFNGYFSSWDFGRKYDKFNKLISDDEIIL